MAAAEEQAAATSCQGAKIHCPSKWAYAPAAYTGRRKSISAVRGPSLRVSLRAVPPDGLLLATRSKLNTGRLPPMGLAAGLPVARDRCRHFDHARHADAERPGHRRARLAGLGCRNHTLTQVERAGSSHASWPPLQPASSTTFALIGNPTRKDDPALAAPLNRPCRHAGLGLLRAPLQSCAPAARDRRRSAASAARPKGRP
jgi:hypothetical protein